jgi:nucleoside 2-deoxyribosyltransferase
MKIYFACSITGGRQYEKTYQALTKFLLDEGHEVPTAHLAQSNILDLERVAGPADVYTRDVNWIQESDILLAEVSVPSHGVGYEIGYALGLKKPVLCIHDADRVVSKMITGNPDPLLYVAAYANIEEAFQQIAYFVHKVTIG